MAAALHVQESTKSSDSPRALIVPGDPRAGNRFPESVHTLVTETIPQVSEPPEKSADF